MLLYYTGQKVWEIEPDGEFPEPAPSSVPIPSPSLLPGAGDVSIVLQEITVYTNDLFYAEIHINSGDQKIATYGIDISYTTDIMSVITSPGSSCVEPETDGFVAAVNAETREYCKPAV